MEADSNRIFKTLDAPSALILNIIDLLRTFTESISTFTRSNSLLTTNIETPNVESNVPNPQSPYNSIILPL
uniref:Uncharacterized protein n=1 Tax=Strongyloides venezuelensis TaxID=75913 RepID=A0A0K0G0P6_STRVS